MSNYWWWRSRVSEEIKTLNACTLVPAVFRWHGKREFKCHFHFSFSHDIEKQIWILLFVFRFRLTLKNGFALRISFFVFASLWKTDMNFVFRFSFSHYFMKKKNDKQNSNLFFNNKHSAKRKFKSVFQSDAKTKIEKWNSNPFFKVKRKRKKKYEVQIRFSKLSENEKQKAKFKSVFQCHAKTKNVNGIWIPFSHAIEKRLAPRYTHYSDTLNLIAKFLYAVTWLSHSKKKRHLSFIKNI